MITLQENEKILATIHQHWIVIVGRMVIVLFLGAVPFLFIPLEYEFLDFVPESSIHPLTVFISSLWWMALTLLFFINWLQYWLNAWIITDTRVISIEQKSLFFRESSEFLLSRVQDITVETPGLFASFLGYGNISVQTAGETSFTGRRMPNLNEAKNLIMEHADKNPPQNT